MKRLLYSAIAAAMLSSSAVAVTVDFEAAPLGSLTNFYAGSGVTFSNTTVQGFGALPGMSGVHSISSTSAAQFFGIANAVVASFSSAQSFVAITAIDLGAAGIRIDAYDALIGGSLVGFGQAFGTGLGIGNFAQVSSSSATIWRVEIYQPLR
ncbi:MAG: hypothetical protein ABIR80_13350, partial [Opitutaceae bacterium]